MFLTHGSLKRPIAMTTGILVMLLMGVLAYRRLGLDVMPQVDVPFVTIVTIYPGATPEQIETEVARRIEDAVVSIDGLKHLNSVCMQSVCQTFLEFNLDRDVDIAATDVREKIGLIRADLPKAVEDPQILKFDVNARPVIRLALTGDLPPALLYDYADNELRARISTLPGVADVRLTGGAPREVHIELNREKLAAHGLTAADVVQRLKEAHRKIPSGNIKYGVREVSVLYDGEFDSVPTFADLIVANVGGRRVRVRDVGEVRMSTKEPRTAAFLNGQRCISIQVVKKGEANAAKVVRRVRKEVARIQRELPGGMRLEWFVDDGDFIRASVQDAWSNILFGIGLTGLILLLFLQNVRSAFIAFLSMPVSIVITFGVMGAFGYTLNTSTLLALGISVGILVTNSIVVLENIARFLERGEDRRTAADQGTAQVAIAVFASAATNVVVFAPIAAMSSLVGRFFVPFAVTITAATLASLFISFTLTPILARMLLRKQARTGGFGRRLANAAQAVQTKMEAAYKGFLRRTARIAVLWVVLVLGAFVATAVFIAPKLGLDFFPQLDRGQLSVHVEFPTDYNLAATTRRVLEMARRIRSLPEVTGTLTVVGRVEGVIGQVAQGVHLAEITVKMLPKTQRKADIYEMRRKIHRLLDGEPACRVSVLVPSVVGGASKPVEMEIRGNDLDVLHRLGIAAVDAARKTGLLTDVENTVRSGKPEIRIRPKRTVLSDMHLPGTLLGLTLRANLEGLKAGTYKIGDRAYDIRVRLAPRKGPFQVENLRLPGPGGRPINLPAAAAIVRDRVPIQIVRSEKRRTVKLLANLRKGAALGPAAEALRAAMAPLMPAGYRVRFVGVYEMMQEAAADFRLAFVTATLLTYLLLAAVLESWTQPFLILTTLPLAYMGLMLGLWIAGMNMSMMGLLAGIMLIGIVVNNAILIMDEVNRLVREGMPRPEAMLAAAPRRFRPIVMTSIAAVLGMLPMALGRGLGSELRASCGVGAVGGIVVSSILSLVFVPMLYLTIVQLRRRKPTPPTPVRHSPETSAADGDE